MQKYWQPWRGKHMKMKLSKEWVNNEINFFGEIQQQQLKSLRKKIFDHKENSSHKAVLKLVAEKRKETLHNVLHTLPLLIKKILLLKSFIQLTK
jgi:hypothetical protein